MKQTDSTQRGGGRRRLEEISQRTYMHTSIAHGHRQQCGEGQRMGAAWRGQRDGKWGTSVKCKNVHTVYACSRFCGSIFEAHTIWLKAMVSLRKKNIFKIR